MEWNFTNFNYIIKFLLNDHLRLWEGFDKKLMDNRRGCLFTSIKSITLF